MGVGEKKALEDLAAAVQGKLASQTSGTNAAQTLTIAAPGTNKRNHLVGVFVITSNTGDLAVTITVQQSGAETLVLQTGAGDQGLMLTGVDIVSDDNQTITIDVPSAGAAQTSLAQAIYYVETL